jgi:hypothetical protein
VSPRPIAFKSWELFRACVCGRTPVRDVTVVMNEKLWPALVGTSGASGHWFNPSTGLVLLRRVQRHRQWVE